VLLRRLDRGGRRPPALGHAYANAYSFNHAYTYAHCISYANEIVYLHSDDHAFPDANHANLYADQYRNI
jgi:hypothetical protein